MTEKTAFNIKKMKEENFNFNVKDVISWSNNKDAIQYIYTHKEEAQEMGEKGRVLVEKLYNIKKCTEQVEEAINEK